MTLDESKEKVKIQDWVDEKFKDNLTGKNIQQLYLKSDLVNSIYEYSQVRFNKKFDNEWHFIKDKDFPIKEGIYFTWRHFGSDEYPQILVFDGKHWAVGNDYPDNMIVAWKEIIPPKESE